MRLPPKVTGPIAQPESERGSVQLTNSQATLLPWHIPSYSRAAATEDALPAQPQGTPESSHTEE